MSNKCMSNLVVMALKEESGDLLEDIAPSILYTGVGKINAAFALSTHLAHHPEIKRVINLGTAGSVSRPSLSMVQCTRFFERDMDATAFGYEAHQTPGETHTFLEVPSHSFSGLEFPITEASLYTADRFETQITPDLDVVDMEGYALAKVCNRLDIPFVSVKFITDGADDFAADAWNEHVKKGCENLRQVLRSLLGD